MEAWSLKSLTTQRPQSKSDLPLLAARVGRLATICTLLDLLACSMASTATPIQASGIVVGTFWSLIEGFGHFGIFAWLYNLLLGKGYSHNTLRSTKEVPMKGFVGDIEEMTEDNSDFRRVLYTAHQMQLVLMALRPGEEIGEETHKDRTQFFRVEKGSGEVCIDGTRSKIKSDTAIIVPAGARHNIRNTGEKPLKLYTIYAPPEHVDGTVHVTKADAKASKEHFDGKTTE
jgi:mannose-6-phosphate isomerase-like protein (cupin superfamily)